MPPRAQDLRATGGGRDYSRAAGSSARQTAGKTWRIGYLSLVAGLKLPAAVLGRADKIIE